MLLEEQIRTDKIFVAVKVNGDIGNIVKKKTPQNKDTIGIQLFQSI